jgi:hypothetical protein
LRFHCRRSRCLTEQGIGSIQQNQNYDSRIFSFAILLSSYFIYNSMSVLDERALESLSFIVNLTRHISQKSVILFRVDYVVVFRFLLIFCAFPFLVLILGARFFFYS